MSQTPLTSFASPARHEAVSAVIRRHSTNPEDVRRVALAGLDLSSVREILDLGCGFGFMTEAVANRASLDARIVGIDACPRNEGPFLERVARTGRQGTFLCGRVEHGLSWPDGAFDLVVASFSLYFFPEILSEVARVLAPAGCFLTVTHAEHSCRDLLHTMGLGESASQLLSVIRRFSRENGAEILAPWFGNIERIDYQNTLSFGAEEIEDLLAYLTFKLPVLAPCPGVEGRRPDELAAAARSLLAGRSAVELEKNDSIFRCREPR